MGLDPWRDRIKEGMVGVKVLGKKELGKRRQIRRQTDAVFACVCSRAAALLTNNGRIQPLRTCGLAELYRCAEYTDTEHGRPWGSGSQSNWNIWQSVSLVGSAGLLVSEDSSLSGSPWVHHTYLYTVDRFIMHHPSPPLTRIS